MFELVLKSRTKVKLYFDIAALLWKVDRGVPAFFWKLISFGLPLRGDFQGVFRHC